MIDISFYTLSDRTENELYILIDKHLRPLPKNSVTAHPFGGLRSRVPRCSFRRTLPYASLAPRPRLHLPSKMASS